MDNLTEIITGAASAVAVVVTAIVAAMPKLRAAWTAIAPLLGRRSIRVVLLAERGKLDEIRAFAKVLREQGYRDVIVTAEPGSVPADAGVVIVWKPAPETSVAFVGRAKDAVPDTQLLVLTFPQLPLERCEQILISNHPVRLLGDLNTMAEKAGK